MSVSEQPERHSSLTKFSVLDFESCFAVKKLKAYKSYTLIDISKTFIRLITATKHFKRWSHKRVTGHERSPLPDHMAAKLTESVPDPYMKRFIKAGRDSQKINKKKLKIGTQTHYIFQQGNFNSNLMHNL